MTTVEKKFKPPDGSTHRLTVTNELTGEVEFELKDIVGGLFIVHQDDDAILGTRQAAFGRMDGILLAAMKAPSVLRDLLKRTGQLENVRELAKKTGLDLTL